MKTQQFLAVLAVCFWATLNANAQGTFQNMNFESATVPNLPAGQYGGMVIIQNGMPGWRGYFGNTETSQVGHNGVPLGNAGLSILGPNHEGGILEGNYTVVLKAGADPFGIAPSAVSASLAQIGTIPNDANSIQFRVWADPGSFLISFGGNSLSPILLQSTPSYQTYAVDISGFAGQTGELRFTAPPLEGNPFNGFYLDRILFSTTAVPEPSTFALAGVGLLGLLLFRRPFI